MEEIAPREMGPSIRVLLMAENLAFTRRARQILREWKRVIVVGGVRNGEELLARSQELQPDVVLLDLGTPDLPGLNMVARLRTALPWVGIVALTALGFDGQGQAVVAAGADTLVSRAAIRTDLLPALRGVVQSRAALRTASTAEGDRS